MDRPVMTVGFLDLCDFTAFTRTRGDAIGARAAQRLHDCVRQSLTPAVRLVKTLGDGVLLVAHDARELARTNRSVFAGWEDVDAPPLRAVAHHGPIVWGEGGDIYGDVVNTAAHLLDRVPPRVCIGTPAYREALVRG